MSVTDDLSLSDIEAAQERVRSLVHLTPVLTSSFLNSLLGHQIFFKAECFQKVGAFKARGAANTLQWMKETGKLPRKVTAHSSGNHAQALAWAAKHMGIECEIFMPRSVSSIKVAATKAYGAEVTLCETRQEAEAKSIRAAENGAVLIPPYDHDQVICGQGTACLEALRQINVQVDAVFAPCGGGGLLSGTLIAARGLFPTIKVFGAEPVIANDAARSLKNGEIFRWSETPLTIADGVRTLAVSERTFKYLKRTDGILEITEDDILKYTQWIAHFLKAHCEPTSALGLAAAAQWLKTQAPAPKKNVLVILSGGNMSPGVCLKVWSENRLP